MGIERSSASTSLATVEKIGPSSEASAASQSCGRRLTGLSGLGGIYIWSGKPGFKDVSSETMP
jgi:hypothetical protein